MHLSDRRNLQCVDDAWNVTEDGEKNLESISVKHNMHVSEFTHIDQQIRAASTLKEDSDGR